MSNYYTICNAVATSISSVVTNTSVVLRKKLQKLESDTLPLVIISPDDKGEKVHKQTFGKGIWYRYPVHVAYVQVSNRTVTLDSAFMNIRETIRNQLFQVTLSGASMVLDTDYDSAAVVKFADYLGSNYDVTGWTVGYIVAETRVN